VKREYRLQFLNDNFRVSRRTIFEIIDVTSVSSPGDSNFSSLTYKIKEVNWRRLLKLFDKPSISLADMLFSPGEFKLLKISKLTQNLIDHLKP